MFPESFRDRDKGSGRNRKIVNELHVIAQFVLRVSEDIEEGTRIGLIEPPAGESQVSAELLPGTFLWLRAELGENLTHVLAKFLVRDVASAVSHQKPFLRQEFVLGELKKCRDHHPLREVAGRSEQHEHRRARF